MSACPCDVCGQKDSDPDENKCSACKQSKPSGAEAGGGGKFTDYGAELKDNVHYTWKYVLPE